jgi:hypothetical protein
MKIRAHRLADRRLVYGLFSLTQLKTTAEPSIFYDSAMAYVHAIFLSHAVDDARRAFRPHQTMNTAQARPTLVLSKNGGDWEIVAFQNTKIAQGVTAASV